ncbi:MAG: M20 family metallopeptidase [Phascolarctobacterium sp.]|nr:M20 family metallopeptidase [Phascolarctobacterium sp.]
MLSKAELEQLIAKEQEKMLSLWQELVNVDCGSSYKEGVDQVANRLEKEMQKIGLTTRQLPYAEAGNMLIAEYGDMSKPFIFLTGHMDTVFSKGTAAKRPFTIKDGKAYGPGVLDMKGGIVLMLTALKILLEHGYDKHPFKIVLAGDEEIAHPKSKAAEVIMQEAKGALAAFNFETGFVDGGIVTSRKGRLEFALEVYGRAAHVGNDPENGRSAIKEIAHKLLDIEALTDWEQGINLNVGVIEGGTVCNATPAYAKITCDMRYVDYSCLPEMKAKLEAIAAKQYVPDTKTVLSYVTDMREMKVLPGTEQLFALVTDATAEMGLPKPYQKAVGGGSDSAYTTAAGVPTLCAMGVQGGRNHTAEEFAVVETLFERCRLFAHIMQKI